MACLKPFAAYRPVKELAKDVAALPYDVMSGMEAREMVKGKPYSFLHVDRAEVDLEAGIDKYSDEVYEKAASNLRSMIDDGTYLKESKPCFYLYRQEMDGHVQTGIVGCASIDDYLDGHIKKHEMTREVKEQDRIRHIDICNANTGPIFLTYRDDEDITDIVNSWTASFKPEYDFCSEDGVRHTVWVIDEDGTIAKIADLMEAVPSLYIADGHHRAASAVKVGQKRRISGYRGDEEFNYFLAVLFPASQLHIMPYNRIVKDLNGLGCGEFLEKVSANFEIEPYPGGMYKPRERHTFGMYISGRWFALKAKSSDDLVENLDVSILQKRLLSPILGIDDPRTDSRIKFIGGIRGIDELVRLVDDEGFKAAFCMYPTSIKELMSIADSGRIMPPKSTWFEPKLRSGLFIHEL